MLTDPQSITVGANTYSLPRIGAGLDTGTFQSADGMFRLTVSSQYGKRIRRTIRLTETVIAPDALMPSTNTPSNMTAYIVLDVPKLGFSATQQGDLLKGLNGLISASTFALVPRFVGGEA